MNQYLFRVWRGHETQFPYFVYADNARTAICRVMDCLGDKNELNLARFYSAEVVKELVNGNGVITTTIPITRGGKE